jgi:hypothetical protein
MKYRLDMSDEMSHALIRVNAQFLTSSGGTSGNLFYPTPKLYIDASYSFKSYFAFKTYAFKL